MSTHVQDSQHHSPYRDPWRWVWMVSLFAPALVAAGPLLMWLTGDVTALWWPLLFLYGVVPVVDRLIPPSRNNPPEAVVPQLESDVYYRYITYALVPVLWAAFVFSAWFVMSHALPCLGMLGWPWCWPPAQWEVSASTSRMKWATNTTVLNAHWRCGCWRPAHTGIFVSSTTGATMLKSPHRMTRHPHAWASRSGLFYGGKCPAVPSVLGSMKPSVCSNWGCHRFIGKTRLCKA